jgi:hypothetical protein
MIYFRLDGIGACSGFPLCRPPPMLSWGKRGSVPAYSNTIPINYRPSQSTNGSEQCLLCILPRWAIPRIGTSRRSLRQLQLLRYPLQARSYLQGFSRHLLSDDYSEPICWLVKCGFAYFLAAFCHIPLVNGWILLCVALCGFP